jgi:hypothetical protein
MLASTVERSQANRSLRVVLDTNVVLSVVRWCAHGAPVT